MLTIRYADRPPIRVGTSVVGCGTRMTTGFLIAAALQNRSRTEEGEYIDVSLFDTAVLWMGYWITYYTGTGDVPAWGGQGFAGLTPSEVFEVADEEPFYLSTINNMLWK